MERFDLPDGWEWKKFPDVAELNPPKSEIKNLSDNSEVTFVPMKSVDDVTGTIVSPVKRELSEVRKGYTYFREGDVIFAKITPCMENGKSAIARNLANGIGFGSTEFHVIRPKQGLLAEWIFAIVRSQVFRDDAQVCMAGAAGQQRVPIDYLQNTEIPIPPLEEQKRIITRIEELTKRVEQARSLCKEAVEETDRFLPAEIAGIFKGENKDEWEYLPLEQIAPIDTNAILPTDYPEKIFNYVALENIEAQTGRIIDLLPTKGSNIKSNKFKFNTEHVLYGKLRPYLNKVIVPEFEGICSTDILPLKPDSNRLSRNYLNLVLRSSIFVEYTKTKMEGTKMPRLRTSDLKEYEIPVPPIDEQHHIVDRLDSIQSKLDQLKKFQNETEEELERFTPALLAKAFKGEL